MLEKSDRARRVGLALTLAALLGAPLFAQNPAVSIQVDAALDRHAISPEIYGVAFASAASLTDLNCPLHRSGGNATSQYNWQVNASNRGSDWYFESLADGPAIAGAGADDFVAAEPERGRLPDADDPDDRMGGAPRAGPLGPRELLDRQVRPADGQRLAVVPRRRQRDRDGRRPGHRQRSERREHAGRRDVPAGVGPASRDEVGRRVRRRRPLLHPRQRAQHLARDAPGRAPDRRDDAGDARQDRRLRGEDQGHRPRGPDRRAGGVGLERLFLQRLRPAVRQPARLGHAPGPQRPRRSGLPALAPRAVEERLRGGAARTSSTSSPSTTTRRAESSPTTSRRRCSCSATARRARSGTRATWTRPGSPTACGSCRG